MKLKTYIVSALVLASTLIGFSLSTKVQAQDSNTRVMSCNGCSEATKKQVVTDIIRLGHGQGQFRYVVINMLEGNVHEYDVNVPEATMGDFSQTSQPPTITLIPRADQALRNKSVKDVRDAIKGINQSITETFGGTISVPASDGFKSAYNALHGKIDFNSYMSVFLSNPDSVSGKVRETGLKILIMTDSVQIGFEAAATVSLSINAPTKVWVVFADGTKIQVILSLTKLITDIQIEVKATDIAFDKDGNRLPLSIYTLENHNFGQSEIDESAIQRYYESIGTSLIFSSSWINGGGTACETSWVCSSNGKTCQLYVLKDKC